MSNYHDTVRAIEWTGSKLKLLDQRILPTRCEYILLEDMAGVVSAIRDMVVRGAPAIGISAAYGVVLAAHERYAQTPNTWKKELEQDLQQLAASRPTAVNLFWALDRMRRCVESVTHDPSLILLAEAQRIHEEDILVNRRMGKLGAALIRERCSLLTHCNTGSLATGGYGTALGVIRSAYAMGHIERVYADETRPWLQGARLTAWELVQDGIPVTLLVEGAAAALLRQNSVRWIIVGADRIAANGDVANKIGTYNLAIIARHHGVKFMVVAPASTIDLQTQHGADIQVEIRSQEEIFSLGGTRTAALGAEAWNPSFDITPAELIDVIVTEKGVVELPTQDKLIKLMDSSYRR